jgi:hypothetical protein
MKEQQPEESRSDRFARRFGEVAHFLTSQIAHEPIPASSDHYRTTEEPLRFTQPEESFGWLDRPDNAA